MLHSENTLNGNDTRHIFSVSELNQYAKEILENTFPMIWVEAEVSNLAQPSSGHIYLTLKDSQAQIRAAMFRTRNQRLRFKPKNGDQVLVKGRLSLYAPRGDYQMIVDTMEEAGLGALQRAFEALKRKLEGEGLFAEARKKPLPRHPKSLGVVTSPTGAAIQDILSVLKRRFPLLPVTIYPCAVQGEEAPAQIIRAIQQANQRAECDVLIVGRGGGSLEDLWAFNHEGLARCIADSPIPIVSAVGHQIDFTIADFVADVRAPTPSAAAEMLSQDAPELLGRFADLEQRLLAKFRQRLQQQQLQLTWLNKRLKHPGKQLEEQSQRLDLMEARLLANIKQRVKAVSLNLENLARRLSLQSPAKTIGDHQSRIQSLELRLLKAWQHDWLGKQQHLSFCAQQLNAVSPLATISRGYGILKDDSGHVIRSVSDTRPDDRVSAQLVDGTLECRVTGIKRS